MRYRAISLESREESEVYMLVGVYTGDAGGEVKLNNPFEGRRELFEKCTGGKGGAKLLLTKGKLKLKFVVIAKVF